MKIDRVTITGADDSVDPRDLLAIAIEYKYVEWGILVSRDNLGINRFPSAKWLKSLTSTFQNDGFLPLSMHICGRWVKYLLEEGEDILRNFERYTNYLNPKIFNRVQINTHKEEFCINSNFANVLLNNRNRQYIIPWDGVNGETILTLYAKYPQNEVVPLFDLSSGFGTVPHEWPARITYDNKPLYCGYAGGLGPHNLERELEKIAEVVDKDGFSDLPVWIDLETHARSNNDKQFDLDKVRSCLEITRPYIV